MTNQKCDHIVAFRYGTEESDYIGEYILKSEIDLPKSHYKHKDLRHPDHDNGDYICYFCPKCGEALNKEGK